MNRFFACCSALARFFGLASDVDTSGLNSTLTILLLVIEVVIPLTLLALCFFPAVRTRLEWGCRLALVLGYLASLCVMIPVCFFGFWRHAIVGLILVAGAYGGYRRIRYGAVGRWRVGLSLVLAASGLALLGVVGRSILVGYRCPQDHVELHSPFRDGTWLVMSGGGSLLINSHNVRNQLYGMDIVGVNSIGKIVDGWLPYSEKLEDYPGFGAELRSPCDGIVLRVEDGNEDLPPGQLPPRNTAGNLVLLGYGRCKILMGHMKQGSVRVHEGEAVSRGQLLGQLGNSGYSTYPHLHISFAVGGTDKGLYDGSGIAATFDGRFLVRNSFLSAGAKD